MTLEFAVASEGGAGAWANPHFPEGGGGHAACFSRDVLPRLRYGAAAAAGTGQTDFQAEGPPIGLEGHADGRHVGGKT